MSANSTKFVYVLDGIKLPEKVCKTIESEIEQLVIRNMAAIDESPRGLFMYGKLPKGIYGGIRIPASEILTIEQQNIAQQKIGNITSEFQD